MVVSGLCLNDLGYEDLGRLWLDMYGYTRLIYVECMSRYCISLLGNTSMWVFSETMFVGTLPTFTLSSARYVLSSLEVTGYTRRTYLESAVEVRILLH